jgi:ligand-binding sensor domain-containing protein
MRNGCAGYVPDNIFNMSGKTFFFIFALLITSLVNAQKSGDKVLSVIEDEYGCQWFGTNKGLLRKCGEIWKVYPVQPDSPGVVNDIQIKSTPSGSELWAGTMNGIIRITYSANAVTSATRFYTKTNSFLTDIINGIAFDKYSTLFFATPLGIGILSMSTWKFLTELQDLADNNISYAFPGGDTIYFGTKGEGVARLVRSADAYSGASSFLSPWSSIPGDDISCIFIDSKGYQWFGSKDGISRHYKPDAKEGWDESYTKILPDKFVTVITEDKAGNIWVGTHKGLVKFNEGKQEASVWTMENGLPSDKINDIFISRDNSLWVGTDKGAVHFNGSEFSSVKTSDYTKKIPRFKKFIKLNIKK